MFRRLSMLSTVRGACAAALLAVCAAQSTQAIASPLTYGLTFSVPSGPSPVGSFTYDATTQDISDLTVMWNGLTFTAFGYGSTSSPLPGPCGAGDLGLFRLLTRQCSGGQIIYGFSGSEGDGADDFRFSATVVAGGDTGASTASSPAAVDRDGFAFVFGDRWTATPREGRIPEPGTSALAMLGLIGLAVARRRASPRRTHLS